MAFPNSFVIVSVIDFQEVDNAVNQAIKEIYQRYDLKGTKSGISLDKKEKKINLESKDDFHLKTILDILQNKISYQSPLGQRLMGKKAGDEFDFTAGNNKVRVKILEVK